MDDETYLGIDLNVVPFQKTDDNPKISDDHMIGDLNQMSLENKKLREMLTFICDESNSLQNHINELTQDHDLLVSNSNKRKFGECDDNGSMESPLQQGSLEKPYADGCITRVFKRTNLSDKSMVVKDGYQWRKYGQKVTRDNPSPRAYYKCSFAPSCPVKKKVQRSVDDKHLLVVIYVGEHNHESIKNEDVIQIGSRGFNSSMEVKLDEVLVEQMASSLGRNPYFIQELAVAISSKILEYDLLM